MARSTGLGLIGGLMLQASNAANSGKEVKMSRKPINWTDEKIAKTKKIITTNRVIHFKNEPGILFDKETGWFLSNPDVVGDLYTEIRFDLLPEDMDFEEPYCDEDYECILPIFGSDIYDGQYWACNDDECVVAEWSGGTCRVNDSFGRDELLDELKVIYIDRTYEDCGFKNNPVRLRLSKVLNLFAELNLDPYIEGEDDYEQGDNAESGNTPAVNLQLVQKTVEMIAPIIDGMGLSAAEKEALKKLI